MLPETKNIQRDIEFINKNISEAVNEMFRRVTSDGNKGHKIEDEKEYPDVYEGVLQDCEFGMILILARDWLKSHTMLSGPIAQDKDVKPIVIEIFERTIGRIFVNNNDKYDEMNVGGEAEDSIVFFSGEPYTYFNSKEGTIFSANLDAAMITTAFLASALKYCNKELKEKDIILNPKVKEKLPIWVKTLRDIGLFVIKEGLEYAIDCKVYYENKFSGFTCDPTSILDKNEKLLLEPNDRLFYTWTACETINDLVTLIDYIEKLENKKIANELTGLITELQSAITEAGSWAYRIFYSALINFERIDVKTVIDDIQNEKLDKEKKDKLVNDLKKYVQNSYHISLYSAIRSLTPGIVLVPEIEFISKKLNDLVINDIIESGLDAITDNRKIYNTLTRSYSLGNSNKLDYTDDAYYPMVVRSLSGLLTRTISSFDEENRDKLLKLVYGFRATLKVHVEDYLIKRRPQKDEDKKLWAVAVDKPYALYATQRTIFGLITYGAFLEKMDAFERVGISSTEEAQKRLQDKLAKSIAKNLLGPDVIKELIEFSSTVVTEKDQTVPQKFPLPEPKWAQDTLIEWLSKFTNDFENSKVESFIKQQAESLKTLWEYKPPKNIKRDKKEKISEFLKNMKNRVEEIFENQLIGNQLKDIHKSKKWEIEKIVHLLFKYMFFQFIESDRKSIKDLKSPSIDLWGNIKSAIDYINSINQNT
jgi:hypothetical protein